MDVKKLVRVNIPILLLKKLELKQESTRLVNNLFWGFNILLVFILILNEFIGFLFVPAIHQLIKGHSLINISLYSLLLYLVPIVAVLIRARLNQKRVFKLKFLFGFEIPILITVIIRQEMLWELNNSLKYLFLVLYAMIILYSIQFFLPHRETNVIPVFLRKLRKLVLYSFNVYFSIIFLGSIIPLCIVLLKNSLHPSFINDISFLGYLLANLFLIALMILVVRLVWFALKYSAKHFKSKVYGMDPKSSLRQLLSVIIIFSALYMLNINNREFTFLYLKYEPSLAKQKEMFFNNRDQLEEEIRHSASLRKYYLGSLQNNTFSWILESELNLDENQTKVLQGIYNVFMYPFFFQNKGADDYDIERQASDLYEEFFDKSLYEPYHYNDFGYSWEGDVHIDKQEIDVEEYGDIAEIQICETYSTDSEWSEEIIIHFELPYNSVVTGLWISDDKNYDKKYPALVAPSGSAQKVYINEVRKQVDPALLSQTGSNKYLLRAFPVMSKKTISRDTSLNEGFRSNYQFRVWYTYKTFISGNNNWVLPKLLDRWNVHWSDKTETSINGEFFQRANRWLPEHITARNPEELQEHAATIADSVLVYTKLIKADRYFNIDANIAIIIDGSLSMNSHRERLIENLNEMKGLFSDFGKLDCYIVGSEVIFLKPQQVLEQLDTNPQLFFGKTNHMNMLDDFTSKVNDYAARYKSVILISDITYYRYPESGVVPIYDYEYGYYRSDSLRPRRLNCPVIVYNMSEEYHRHYPHDFFNRIVFESNGGFARDMDDLVRLLTRNAEDGRNLIVFQDDIAYFKSEFLVPSDTLFQDFAAKEFINQYRLDESAKLEDIDVLHEMAENENIVTKYSSMIALVNQAQIDSLYSAQTNHDRYNNFREMDNGGSGVLGMMDMFSPSIPKYPETMVIFMFFFLCSTMIFADRFS